MLIKDLPEAEEITQIRESVRRLCADFPGEHWRALDQDRGYPVEFVEALSTG